MPTLDSPSPELVAIAGEAGIDARLITAGQLRRWRSTSGEGETPESRVVFAAFSVDESASRVRFHVAYHDDDELRATFSLACCLLQIEAGDLGLDVAKTVQALLEQLLRDFRWAVDHLQPVH